MKLPSAKQLLEHSSATLKRFPFVIADAIIGTAAAIWLIEIQPDHGHEWLNSILLASLLGLPFLTTITVVLERQGLSTAGKAAVNLGAILLLALYAFLLPRDVFSAPEIHLVRFALLSIGLHFLAAFAPFTAKDELNGFWQYNKSLFLRFLTGGLFSFVLYMGLFIAMQAVHHLFNVEINDDRYFQLWCIIVGVFHTWFFLGGVPADLRSLESETRYPKGLKVFTQNILLPLVLIYLLILYAYEIKIIAEWDWPKGWVSNLVLGFSVAGIFSLLLLWPIQDKAENSWVRIFARRYYLALIPLVFMLLLAIWMRISEYGVTENRYFVAALGVWLLAMVLYFLASKTKSIKVIPASLCMIAFLSSVGPWSAFTVSETSQHGRLAMLLQEGGVTKTKDELRKLPSSELKEINSIVRYLTTMHGAEAMQDLFIADSSALDSLARMPQHEQARRSIEIFGIPYLQEADGPGRTFSFKMDRSLSLSIDGYAFYIGSLQFGPTPDTRQVKAGETGLVVESDPANRLLVIKRMSTDSVSVRVDLGPLLEKLMETYGSASGEIPPEQMTIEGTESELRWKMFVVAMHGERRDESFAITSLKVDLLINTGEGKPETGERRREN